MLILGKHCPDNKGLSFSLQSIFGVNQTTANKICAIMGVQRFVPLKTLFKAGRISQLQTLCRDHLSREKERWIKDDIRRLLEIKHYRGVRHMFRLPVRGQRTRTNSSTSKRLAVIKQLATRPQRSNGRKMRTEGKKSGVPQRKRPAK